MAQFEDRRAAAGSLSRLRGREECARRVRRRLMKFLYPARTPNNSILLATSKDKQMRWRLVRNWRLVLCCFSVDRGWLDRC
ncbi:MAG: hypothetical protein KatS3mg110_3245 [Pirellulaceae bacterium]|nr:MAG: hypothetical protein KatS3mg110_3245 [Pirellulaceae bacterium]